VDILDLALLFQGDGEQVDGDGLLVGEAQVGIGRVALGLRPTHRLPMFTNLKIECYQLRMPVHRRTRSGCWGTAFHDRPLGWQPTLSDSSEFALKHLITRFTGSHA
jgi:hypothetical protein